MARNYKKEWEEVRKKLITYTKDPTINYQYGTIKKDNETENTTKIKDNKTENTTKDDWDKAIKIFQDRLRNYFFNSIENIIETECGDGEGFAIVTLQCALIETFAAFREGKVFGYQTDENHKEHDGYPKTFKYKDDNKEFTKFLETHFGGNFCSDEDKQKIENADPNNLSLFKQFYKNVRCGLVHQTRTKGNWCINMDFQWKEEQCNFLEKKEPSSEYIVRYDDNEQKIRLYRTILHQRLSNYLKKYCEELKENNQNGEELRRRFARCMDHLFDFKPTYAYDDNKKKYYAYAPNWWVEVS